MFKLLSLCTLVLITTNLLAQPEFKIGAVLPLSGDAQAFGQEARMALEHALADNPGKKYQYKLVLEDDELSPAKASLAAKKLLDIDGAKVIFSNWSYGGNAVASALKNKKVLNLAFAWDQKILEVGNNNFIMAGPPEDLAQKIILKIKAEEKKSIILIGFQEAGVEFAFNAIEDFAQKNGIKVIKRIEINPAEQADFRSLLMQIKSLQPEYLVTCLIYPQMLELLKQMKILKIDLPIGSIGQPPFGPELKPFLPKIWWTFDYFANLKDQIAISKRTGLNDISGYPSYYEGLKAIIKISEQYSSEEIPSNDYLQEALENYKSDKSILGQISYEGRRFRSENALMIDQLARY